MLPPIPLPNQFLFILLGLAQASLLLASPSLSVPIICILRSLTKLICNDLSMQLCVQPLSLLHLRQVPGPRRAGCTVSHVNIIGHPRATRLCLQKLQKEKWNKGGMHGKYSERVSKANGSSGHYSTWGNWGKQGSLKGLVGFHLGARQRLSAGEIFRHPQLCVVGYQRAPALTLFAQA